MHPAIVLLAVLVLACNRGKTYHNTTDEVSYNSPAVQDIIAFQNALNTTFKDPETSPLPDRYRKNFEGLAFFASDTLYRVKATLERTPNTVPTTWSTTTDRTLQQVLYGIAYFTLNGKEHQLEMYQDVATPSEERHEENLLFLPFLDDTNGTETYGGGRYMDLPIPQGDTLVIDFNKAYAPYCAYNAKYSCPLVPRQNYLHTKVKAGVKAFGNTK